MNAIWHILPSGMQHDMISNGILWAIGIATTWVLAQIGSSVKSKELRDLADDGAEFVSDFLEEAVKGGLTPTAANLPAIETILIGQYTKQSPKMKADAKTALAAIIHHELAVQTGNHSTLVPPGLNVTTAAAASSSSGLTDAAKVGILVLGALAGSGLARGEMLTAAALVRPGATREAETPFPSSLLGVPQLTVGRFSPPDRDGLSAAEGGPIWISPQGCAGDLCSPPVASPAHVLAAPGSTQTVTGAASLDAATRFVFQSTLAQTAPPAAPVTTTPAQPAAPPATEPLPPIVWGNPTLYHGVSAPLLEFFPGQTHPITLLNGAGYSVGICEGDFDIGTAGKQLSVVCIGVDAFLNVQAPAGQPVGGSQLVPHIGFAGDTVGIGAVLPLLNANGAWFQGPIGLALRGSIPWSLF